MSSRDGIFVRDKGARAWGDIAGNLHPTAIVLGIFLWKVPYLEVALETKLDVGW